MKKVTFNVASPKENSTSKVLKVLNSVKCRFLADFENGVITAECAEDTDLDAIIDLVDNNYVVSGISVDNMVQGAVPQLENVSETIAENVPEVQNSSENTALANFPTLSESENAILNSRINNLIKTTNHFFEKGHITAVAIDKFIASITTEISMYAKVFPDVDNLVVGDIVSCYYGHHLHGEVSGAFTNAVVCDVSDNYLICLAPITKLSDGNNSQSYITFTCPEDIRYSSHPYKNGIVMLDKVGLFNRKRVREIIGEASPEFMGKVFEKLKTTFDFTRGMQVASGIQVTEEAPVLPEAKSEAEPETKPKIAPKLVPEANSKTTSAPETEPEPEIPADTKHKPKAKQSTGSTEAILYEHLSPVLDEIEPDWVLRKKILEFMISIEIPTGNPIFTDAFTFACSLDKVTYNNLLAKLQPIHNKYSEMELKKKLQDVFGIWLAKYPELSNELSPKASIIDLLKFFVKYVGKSKN